MPPKKATEAVASKIEGAPDEGVMLFAFECLKAFGEDRLVGADCHHVFLSLLLMFCQLDMNALSKALGHTNTKSTRNAFIRHKNKWGFGNIPCKTGTGKSDDSLPVDGSSTIALLSLNHMIIGSFLTVYSFRCPEGRQRRKQSY